MCLKVPENIYIGFLSECSSNEIVLMMHGALYLPIASEFQNQ